MSKFITAVMYVFLILNAFVAWISFIEVCFGNYAAAINILSNGGIALGMWFALKIKV